MDKEYKAFISYSHDDEEFGSWLHKELEKYKIPKRLKEDYPHLPKTLYPIFRDRYELNAGDDLGVEILKALEKSDALIVVCSTKSSNSKWVNKEIIDFKMMHGEDRIFPIILDGKPFAKESDKFDDSLECFPEALKYKIDSEWNLTDKETSILASSTIEKEDGKELAKLKLISGILGVPFGEFYRRDEEQKRRDRDEAIDIWSLVSFIIIGFAIFSWVQRDIAIENEKLAIDEKEKANDRLYDNILQQGLIYKNYLNEPLKAKLLFAEAVNLSQDRKKGEQARILYDTINRGVKLKDISEYNTSSKIDKYENNYISKCNGDVLDVNKDKTKILFSCNDGTIQLWNIKTNKRIVVFKNDNIYKVTAILSKDEKKILSWGFNKKVLLWDIETNKELLSFKHTDIVLGAILSKDKILSWSKDGIIKLWDIKTNSELLSLNHKGWISKAKFNKSKTMIISWNENKIIKVWDIRNGKLLFTLHHEDIIIDSYFNEDNTEFISQSNNIIKKWDIKNIVKVFYYKKDNYKDNYYDKHKINKVKGNKSIEIQDNKIIISNNFTNKKLLTFKYNDDVFESNVKGTVFNENQDLFLTWDNKRLITLWNSKNGNKLLTLKNNFDILELTFSKDHKSILVLDMRWNVTVYKIDRNRKLNKKYYPLEAQVETGTYLTQSGEVKALSKEEWLQKKKEYEQVLKDSK